MKNFLALSVCALALSGALVSVPALADMDGHSGQSAKGGEMFEKKDLNGDGVISKDEFLTYVEGRFSQMDKNGDGSISKDEAQSAHKSMREKMKEHREMRMDKRGEKAGSSDE